MTEPKVYIQRPFEVEALQLRLGETTKSDLLAFCPSANIGTPVGGDERDIRWVSIPIGGGETDLVANTDWILHREDRGYWICPDDIFTTEFIEKES